MSRDVVDPVVDDGQETHPAFGMIGASRVSQSPPGQVLFDSEIRHQHYVVLRIAPARRRRELNRDWIHADSWPFIEVAMSEAQWASFVSSMNTAGVPCTVQFTRDDPKLPEIPYDPRLGQSVKETRDAAVRAIAKVREAFDRVKEKPTKAHIRDLEIALEHVPSSVEFASRSLNEHVENTVTKARADIEAMVARHAEQIGIDAGTYTAPLALEAADSEL